jgi:hypothetical protein
MPLYEFMNPNLGRKSWKEIFDGMKPGARSLLEAIKGLL